MKKLQCHGGGGCCGGACGSGGESGEGGGRGGRGGDGDGGSGEGGGGGLSAVTRDKLQQAKMARRPMVIRCVSQWRRTTGGRRARSVHSHTRVFYETRLIPTHTHTHMLCVCCACACVQVEQESRAAHRS